MQNDGHPEDAELQKLKEQLAAMRSVLTAVEENRGLCWLPLKWAMRLSLGRTIRAAQTQVDLWEGTLVAYEGRTVSLRFGRRKS